MNKLLAIWRIIWSDQYAVFTFEEAAPNPEWLTAPIFRWIVSKNWKDNYFFLFIRQRLTNIEKYNSPTEYER